MSIHKDTMGAIKLWRMSKREIAARLHIWSAAAISLFVRSTGFLLVYIRPTPDRHGNARRCIKRQTIGIQF